MGRKEISQMTFFNFASAIAIGEIAASLVVDDHLSITNGIYALTGWSLYTILMSYFDIGTSEPFPFFPFPNNSSQNNLYYPD